MNGKDALVFLSDFDTVDGSVAAMYGIADREAPDVRKYDLTHEISPFQIWEASYRLAQVMEYWNAGTVFVCVVDPGVGKDRDSVAVRTASGHYILTPDNGVLTHVYHKFGISERRVLQEALNRQQEEGKPFTYHGRDIFASTGARLAGGLISFTDIGKELTQTPRLFDCSEAVRDGEAVTGRIDIHDKRYGSLWTNIPAAMMTASEISPGDVLSIKISRGDEVMYEESLPYCHSFADVPVGKALVYTNSLMNVSVGINQKHMSKEYGITSGPEWQVKISRN